MHLLSIHHPFRNVSSIHPSIIHSSSIDLPIQTVIFQFANLRVYQVVLDSEERRKRLDELGAARMAKRRRLGGKEWWSDVVV